MMPSDNRARVFACVLYPESIPENWIDFLKETHVPIAISPVHDQDIAADGSQKKPHYHVVFYFDGKKSKQQVLKMLQSLGVSHVEQVNNTRSYNRYLCHLDNPEKAQYNREDITILNGAVVDLSLPLTPEQRAALRGDVLAWCRDNNITEYAELVDYAAIDMPDWMDYVETHTIFLNGYIRSRRCREEN